MLKKTTKTIAASIVTGAVALFSIKAIFKSARCWVTAHPKAALERLIDFGECVLLAHMLVELILEGGPVPSWEVCLWLGSLIAGLCLDYGVRKLSSASILRLCWAAYGYVFFLDAYAQTEQLWAVQTVTWFLVVWKAVFFALGYLPELKNAIFKVKSFYNF